MAFDPSKFRTQEAKPLPVILLLDCSGSMASTITNEMSRIGTLNTAVKSMISTLAKEETNSIKFSISIIAFSNNAVMSIESKNAGDINFQDLSANGSTSMGAAIKLAKDFIEDKTKILSRAYRPTVILVSDGEPTDNWEMPLDDFVRSGRSSKCDRWAMGIGSEADNLVLQKFIDGTNNRVIKAEDANGILEFFKMVTMSVTTRSVSQNPNIIATPVTVSNDGENGKKNLLNAENNADPWM
jgi:uncharacterized protein YegL